MLLLLSPAVGELLSGSSPPAMFFNPVSLLAILLGLIVQIQGAKSFAGMPIVALAFGLGILTLALRWRRAIRPEQTNNISRTIETLPGGAGPSQPAS
jgi:hypothetical protein